MKVLFVSFALTIISVAVNAQPTPSQSPAELAKQTLSKLTLERKVAQLVCVEIQGDATAGDPRMKQWLGLVKDYGIGGLVIYGGTARNAAIVINRLQEASTIP